MEVSWTGATPERSHTIVEPGIIHENYPAMGVLSSSVTPFQPLGHCQPWELPGLVNIQKAMENPPSFNG